MSDQPEVPSGGASAGDPRRIDSLLPHVYDELRAVARRRLAELPRAQTLQPTMLVHEAYVRLRERDRQTWADRSLFFAAAARAMRDILVERYRQRRSEKRGGGRERVDFDDQQHAADAGVADAVDLIALDGALRKLAEVDPRMSDLVTMRFFAGLSLEDAALALGVSRATAARDWRMARAWLHEAIGSDA